MRQLRKKKSTSHLYSLNHKSINNLITQCTLLIFLNLDKSMKTKKLIVLKRNKQKIKLVMIHRKKNQNLIYL